jgi:hypothetical protein
MGVIEHLLVPGVKEGEHADLGSQVLGVGRDLKQRLTGGLEEQVVEHLLISQHQRIELVGKGEDDVEVGNG